MYYADDQKIYKVNTYDDIEKEIDTIYYEEE